MQQALGKQGGKKQTQLIFAIYPTMRNQSAQPSFFVCVTFGISKTKKCNKREKKHHHHFFSGWKTQITQIDSIDGQAISNSADFTLHLLHKILHTYTILLLGFSELELGSSSLLAIKKTKFCSRYNFPGCKHRVQDASTAKHTFA